MTTVAQQACGTSVKDGLRKGDQFWTIAFQFPFLSSDTDRSEQPGNSRPFRAFLQGTHQCGLIRCGDKKANAQVMSTFIIADKKHFSMLWPNRLMTGTNNFCSSFVERSGVQSNLMNDHSLPGRNPRFVLALTGCSGALTGVNTYSSPTRNATNWTASGPSGPLTERYAAN
ncbi:hypothetical protein INP83_10895 [Mucilaginibacter sp. 21P]|nr:hypothetical protein [Mucilaginibacter sp. 21P]QXV63624.1 hypothetical protein INP83_10895 [Mucilaginibacter sp. 21P]